MNIIRWTFVCQKVLTEIICQKIVFRKKMRIFFNCPFSLTAPFVWAKILNTLDCLMDRWPFSVHFAQCAGFYQSSHSFYSLSVILLKMMFLHTWIVKRKFNWKFSVWNDPSQSPANVLKSNSDWNLFFSPFFSLSPKWFHSLYVLNSWLFATSFNWWAKRLIDPQLYEKWDKTGGLLHNNNNNKNSNNKKLCIRII